MASFTSVRYGSKFKPVSGRTSNPYGGYVNSPGAGRFSLASLVGNQNPGAIPSTSPAVSPTVTPAHSATPSDAAKTQTHAAFAPPTPDSLASDPILKQIRDLGQRSIDDARTGALTGAESALIGYGSVDVPQTIKDLYAKDQSSPILAAFNDQNTAQAAQANPDSLLRMLAGENDRNVANVDQAENAQNLYYSSHHANQLGDQATAYRQKQGQAQQSLAELLAGANQGVLDASQHASDQFQAELPNAYGRALDLASLLGGDPTAGSGATDPTAPPQTDLAGSGFNFSPGPGVPPTADDYWTALMQAYRNPSRPVAYTGA